MSESVIRSFLAVEIPAVVRRAIASSVAVWRRQLPRASWVRPDHLHLTLKFLGDVDEARLGRLGDQLAPALASSTRATVEIAGGGCFPSRGRPRVAWLGGRAPGLEAVAAVVEEVAARAGHQREQLPWQLHLTLARSRGEWGEADAVRFADLAAGLAVEAFAAAEVVLLASELRPTGAVYTRLRSFPLA